MCTATAPGQAGPTYWTSGAPGMTAQEVGDLPKLDAETIYGAFGGSVIQRKQERETAIEKWKTDNPDRYNQALEQQKWGPNGPPKQGQRTATRGAGAEAGAGGASSANTLLTGDPTQGVDPSQLDLAKQSLLGL
ncbi:hypothetical protein [Bordetella genomosp. 1]|uniref:Novel toxin 15 domain-containing protein n=1 Tax=Bordetella genomosp. 1 TaxID=1395607 RepID=A0ABX4EW88_9BORD|nr:hypothetical protein [Bordetella genomosp. 1]OZI58718.1 hypothetical protein CAL27_18725 [Bordetella genomosp. 1]